MLQYVNRLMSRNVFKEQPDGFGLISGEAEPVRYLILHNDEVNTFDHVISCLVEICLHEPLQAEQCAFITHFRGKCDVSQGSYGELAPKRQALLDKGLQVTID